MLIPSISHTHYQFTRFLAPPCSTTFYTLPFFAPKPSHIMKLENMQDEEDVAEEQLLTLGLSPNISTSTTRKRKRIVKDEPVVLRDDKFIAALLRSREQMLKLDPRRRRHGLEDGKGLQLIHLLLISATAVDSNNTNSAIDSLTELYRTASLNGDPIQRVAAYFADGLAAKLLTKSSPVYKSIVANPTPEEEFSAFTYLYRASPYYPFAHFTANQAIIEAFEEHEHERRSLHVVDFDVSYGFQWPSLIQPLSEMATSSKPVSLRITGFGQNADDLRETETRLTNFANGCHNLVFKFEGCLRGTTVSSKNIKIKKDETLVVNSVFYLQSLRNSNEIAATLKNIYMLNPSVVILLEKEGDRTPRPTFLLRFMESLHYFAAMFDSLDDCLPAESVDRFSIEMNHLGREIIERIVTGDEDCKEGGNERLETWKDRMGRHGFEGVKLSSRSVSQAKLLLKMKSYSTTTDYRINCGGFQINERDEGRGLSLGWQDRHLITASAWRCNIP